jgi:ditrans,polycis-polyprenyl diphosphate synthase
LHFPIYPHPHYLLRYPVLYSSHLPTMASLHKSGISKWFAASPPLAWTVRQLRELLIGALRQGPIPQHVAFVMDGNRRFAREQHIETVEGHNMGFEALARVRVSRLITTTTANNSQILEVCYKAGVKVVTIYAFSIENFKRSKHEVDALMAMAKLKLSQLAEHGALLDRYGAQIRILGQRDLVRADVLEEVDKAVSLTAKNNRYGSARKFSIRIFLANSSTGQY